MKIFGINIGREPKQVPKTETKEKNLVPFSALTYYNQYSTDLSLEAQMRAYKSWVYAAVSKRSQEVAGIQLTLNKITTKGGEQVVEEVKVHPVLDLLDKVNPFMTYADLVETTFTYWDLTGNAYWWLIKSGGKIVEIWPYLRPDRMIVVPSESEFVSGYNYHIPGTANYKHYEPDEIIHFKYVNPLDPYYGVSPVKAAELAIATDEKAGFWNYRFFGNSARPDFLISFEEGISDDQAERFRTQWENAHKQGKEHRVGFISKGKVEKTSYSQKDMDFISQRNFARDEILAAFKVPKAILDPQEINFAASKVAKEIFLEEVIVPNMKRFVGYLNEFLLPQFGGDNLFFDFISPMEEDVEQKLKRYESLARVGAISPNEVREDEGMPPYEGGDNIYLPSMQIPVGGTEGAIEQEPIKLGTVNDRKRIKKYNVRVRSHSKTAEEIEKIKKDLKKSGVLKKKKFVMPKKKIYKSDEELAKEMVWKELMRKNEKDAEKMAKLVNKEFKRQEASVQRSLHEKDLAFKFNVETETEIFTKVFTPLILEFVEKYGEEALNKLGLANFDTTKIVADHVGETTRAFAKDVSVTTEKRIRTSIKNGLTQGETTVEIKKRIGNIFIPSRATAISRTEVGKSSNYGIVEGWKQSGVVEKKEWFTNPGACPICVPRHGKTISINKSFHFTGEANDPLFGDVSAPPAHVNCRCTVLPVVKTRSQIMVEGKAKMTELDNVIKETKEKGDKEIAGVREIKENLNKELSNGQE